MADDAKHHSWANWPLPLLLYININLPNLELKFLIFVDELIRLQLCDLQNLSPHCGLYFLHDSFLLAYTCAWVFVCSHGCGYMCVNQRFTLDVFLDCSSYCLSSQGLSLHLELCFCCGYPTCCRDSLSLCPGDLNFSSKACTAVALLAEICGFDPVLITFFGTYDLGITVKKTRARSQIIKVFPWFVVLAPGVGCLFRLSSCMWQS